MPAVYMAKSLVVGAGVGPELPLGPNTASAASRLYSAFSAFLRSFSSFSMRLRSSLPSLAVSLGERCVTSFVHSAPTSGVGTRGCRTPGSVRSRLLAVRLVSVDRLCCDADREACSRSDRGPYELTGNCPIAGEGVVEPCKCGPLGSIVNEGESSAGEAAPRDAIECRGRRKRFGQSAPGESWFELAFPAVLSLARRSSSVAPCCTPSRPRTVSSPTEHPASAGSDVGASDRLDVRPSTLTYLRGEETVGAMVKSDLRAVSEYLSIRLLGKV